jgi:hypothetical protein
MGYLVARLGSEGKLVFDLLDKDLRGQRKEVKLEL